MKQYQFEYMMSIKFSGHVEEHHFSMKCIPFYDQRQKYYKLNIQVNPFCTYWKSKDSFDNTMISGYCKPLHNQFDIIVSGFVEINDDNPATDQPLSVMRYPSKLTHPGAFIDELTSDSQEILSPLDDIRQMMSKLHHHMEYVKSSTSTLTTARESYALKQGVCQDYAHILLAALRKKGFAARYVAGIVEGEGESHAWVEVFANEQWIGLDPTRNLVADTSYLKLSHGRDAEDCLINRGLFVGNVYQNLTISAKMTPM